MGRYFYQRMSRVFSVMLAGLLWGQCLFAYQPEKTIWDQRRAAARAARAVLVASRSDGTHSSSPLAAQFPPVQSAYSSLSPSISCSLPLPFLRQHEALLGALSPAYGTVRKVALGGPSGRGRLVIHIQDVHQNFEAQWNIRSAVSDLLKSGRVGLVALEGSAEPIDLQPFVDFPHRKAMEKVADLFLKENRISGPIHAAITAEGRLPRMLGIEDPLHYEANVKAVRDSAPRQEEMRELTRTIQTEIDHQKKTVFSPALLDLDRTITDYRNEKISLGVYLETLAERDAKGVGSGKFPAVRDFLRALGMERSLDFARVETERGRLIEKLTQALSADEISSLMNESMAYRAGHRRFADFYSGLKTLCQKKKIRLSEFPAMDAYIRYVLLADRINPELLMSEMVELEKYAVAQIARSTEEKELAQRSRVAWLAGRLADFALTPAEWAEWAAAGEKLGLNLSTFESFYREALARDVAMAENLWAATNPGDVAVLVTGGFHGDGLARELGRRGVTVVSYVPKIEKVDTIQGAAYLSVFSQEKTPLEKLFRGEKLFLGANSIAPQERHIALPAAAVLAAISAIGILVGFDFQLAFEGLDGVGVMRDVTLNSGAAQAVVEVGSGALMIKLMTNGGRVGPLEIYPNSKGSWAGSVGWVQRYWDKVKNVVTEEMVGVVKYGETLTFWGGFFKSFQGRMPAVVLGIFLPAMAGVPYIWLIFGPALIFVAVGQIIFLKDHGDMSPRQMVVRAVGILLLNGIAFFGPVIMGGMALGVAPETAVELVVRFGEGIGLAVAAHLVWNGFAEWGKNNKKWAQDYRLVGGKNDNKFPENVQIFPLGDTASIIGELERVKNLSVTSRKHMIIVVDQGDFFKKEYLDNLLRNADEDMLKALFDEELDLWSDVTDDIKNEITEEDLFFDEAVDPIKSWVTRSAGVVLVMKPVNLLIERPVFQHYWLSSQDPFYNRFQETFSINYLTREAIAQFLLNYEGLELAKGEFLKDTFFRDYLKTVASSQNRPNVLALVRNERFSIIANEGAGQELGSDDIFSFRNYKPENDSFKQLLFLCREWLKSQVAAEGDLLKKTESLNNFVALFPDGITPMHDAAARSFLLRWILAKFEKSPEPNDRLKVGKVLAKLHRDHVFELVEGFWNSDAKVEDRFWKVIENNDIDEDGNTNESEKWLKKKLGQNKLVSEEAEFGSDGSPVSVFHWVARLGSVLFGKSKNPSKKVVVHYWKIRFWDPLREQAQYFLTWVIVAPYGLSLWITTMFGGGLGMLLVSFVIFGYIALAIMVPLFLEREHKSYPEHNRRALVPVAHSIGVLTLAGFVLAYALLSPMGVDLIAYTGQFFSLIPEGEFKAFVFAAFLGFLPGVWRHAAHTEKTFANYLQWKSGGYFSGLLPLSGSAAKSSPSLRPVYANYQITLPRNENLNTPDKLLRTVNTWYQRIPRDSTPRFNAISEFVDFLRIVNPQFCQENKHLIRVHDLAHDLAQLKYVINAAIFCPLNATAADFPTTDPLYFELDPNTWEGSLYLGEEIWRVHYVSSDTQPGPRADHLSHGFGFISRLSQRNTVMGFNQWVKEKFNRRNGYPWPWVDKSIKETNPHLEKGVSEFLEGVVVQYLKDHAFARISLGPDRMLYAPTIDAIAEAITKSESPLRGDTYSTSGVLSMEAQIAALRHAMSFLKLRGQYELAIQLFYFWMGDQFPTAREGGKLSNLYKLLKTENIASEDDLRKRIVFKKTAAKEQVAEALSFLDTLYNKHFLTYPERYVKVFGNDPPPGEPEVRPVGELIVIEQTPQVVGSIEKPSPDGKKSPRGGLSENRGLIRNASNRLIDEIDSNGSAYSPAQVVNRLVRAKKGEDSHAQKLDTRISEYLPLAVREMDELKNGILGNTATNSRSLSDGILTIKKLVVDVASIESAEDREKAKELESFVEELQAALLASIEKGEKVVRNLIEYSEALELNENEVAFLNRYAEIQETVGSVSIQAILRDLDDAGEAAMLEAQESLIAKLKNPNWVQLVIEEEILDEGDPVETESEAGKLNLSGIMDSGFQVVVHEKEFEKFVQNKEQGKKSISNVLNTIRNKYQEKDTFLGQRLMIRAARPGFIKEDVHKFRTYGFNVIVKMVGKTMVVLWVGPKAKTHAASGLSSNPEFDKAMVAQAKKIQENLEEYVLIDANFKVVSGGVNPDIIDTQRGIPPGGSANSLIYLLTGRPLAGLAGAVGEGVLLAVAGVVLGPVIMLAAVLPIFSLIHVWIQARQNPDLRRGDLAALFFWHWVLAVPYGLIGMSGFQEWVGGEQAAQVLAVAWQLVSDMGIIFRDQWEARRDAAQIRKILEGRSLPSGAQEKSNRDLLPEATSLSVEEMLGPSRVWLRGVQQRLRQPGYARVFERALVRGRSDTAMGSWVQAQLDRLLSYLTGRLVRDDAPLTSISIVSPADVSSALRSAEITKALEKAGRNPPRLVLAGADPKTVDALIRVSVPGVVDVVSTSVVSDGQLDSVILLNGLEGLNLPANSRFTVFLSNDIGVDLKQLVILRTWLADALRRALENVLGARLSPMDFEMLLEIVSRIGTSA